MKLLVFSTLFPHPGAPHHGIFVWERLRAWLDRHGGEAVVVAPVPFVPRSLARGAYAEFREVPAEESREGVRILHPRYLLIPKLSMSSAPLSLAWRCHGVLRRLRREGFDFDLVDAHYLYPDAVAAALLARKARRPLVVTARGTDVNQIPRHAIPRTWLRWMLRHADAAITVAEALRALVEPLAPARLPIHVLRNGVDLERFRPVPRDQARAELGWEQDHPLVVSVGHLIERKGHHHLLAALPHLAGDVRVKIVGAGPWQERLRRQALELGVAERVEFTGALAHDRLRQVYSAADLLVLLSSREGWPNVLLEAMACGTPVLATRVFGTPEVVRDPAVGALIDRTEPEAIARAVTELLAGERASAAIRGFAEQHSWAQTVDGMQELFESICSPTPPLPAGPEATLARSRAP